MTKLTKNEKILRKASEKWKNFLAEGAFKNEVDLSKQEDDEFQYNQAQAQMKTPMHMGKPIQVDDQGNRFIIDDEGRTNWLSVSDDYVEENQVSEAGPDGMTPGAMLVDLVDSGEMEWYEAAPGDSMEELMKHVNSGAIEDFDAAQLAQFGIDAEDVEFEWNKTQGLREARMGEYGKIDAEDGNPPSKIGRGNEEYMAAYNAVLQARGEEPLDIQKPDQAYLDALRSGQLQEAVGKRARQLLSEGLTPEQVKEKILEEGFGDFIRKGADFVKAKTGLGRTEKTRELYNKMKFEKDKYFEFRDKFYPDAKDIRNFMEFVEQNARKQGGGSGGMMSDLAYRAISKEKFRTMDSPITYLKQARKISEKIEKMMLDGAVDQKGDKTFKVIRDMAESILKDFEQTRTYLKELRVAIKSARKSGDAQALKDIYKNQVEHERYLSQSQARADKAFAAKAKEAERMARKDKPKDDEDIIRGKSTQRFGMATNLEEASGARTAEAVNQIETILNDLFDDGVDNATLITLLKQIIVDIGRGYVGQPSESKRSASLEEAREIGEGDEVRIIGGALTGAEGEVIELTKTGGIGAGDSAGLPAFVVLLSKDADKRVYGAAGDEVIVQPKFVEHKFYSGDFGMELYDIDEKKNLKEEVIEDFVFELEGGITFADVEEAGLVTPGVDSVIDNGDGYAQVYSEPEAMAKMAKTLEAMTGVMVSPKSHGAVDERSKDDERDLEKPVKYGSGAELEFDKKAQKFYDRKRDMYIDDPEEEDNLTREDRTTMSSDPEMDQVMDIAADMLELSARSRIPVNLKSVQSALEAQSFDAKMEKGMLIVDDKYVIADKKFLPATAQKISFTDYAADYLSNIQGEQQDLPLG